MLRSKEGVDLNLDGKPPAENRDTRRQLNLEFPAMLRTHHVLCLVLFLTGSGTLWGQENVAMRTATPVTSKTPAKPQTSAPPHKFWDTQNLYLFTGVGAARMLDYASTRHFRDQGNPEWLLSNSVVDNRPLFVGIELAGTAASIGVSYALHRTGHHQLERWVSVAHIGVGVGGSIHNYLLKPPELTAQPGIAILPAR
jgi:hypothetical protein